jgi:hypothetical protein
MFIYFSSAKPWKCPVDKCDKEYVYRGWLKRHLRIKHDMVIKIVFG